MPMAMLGTWLDPAATGPLLTLAREPTFHSGLSTWNSP